MKNSGFSFFVIKKIKKNLLNHRLSVTCAKFLFHLVFTDWSLYENLSGKKFPFSTIFDEREN